MILFVEVCTNAETSSQGELEFAWLMTFTQLSNVPFEKSLDVNC